MLAFKQRESLETQCLGERLVGATLGNGARIERKGIEEEQNTQQTRSEELVLICLKSHDVYKPHCEDETDGAKHPYGREILNGIHACLAEI